MAEAGRATRSRSATSWSRSRPTRRTWPTNPTSPGTLTEILVQEGETVAIGTPIARVGRSDGTRDRAAPAAGPVAAAGGPPPPAVAKASVASTPPTAATRGETAINAPTRSSEASRRDGDGRPKASPVARRIAKEKGLDLAQLQGLWARWAHRQGGRGAGGIVRGWRGLGGAENGGAAPARRTPRGRDRHPRTAAPRLPRPPRARSATRSSRSSSRRSRGGCRSRRRRRRTSTWRRRSI